MQKKEFVIPLSHNCRKRHSHLRIRNKIIEFTLQLEIFVNKQWFPLVRYDTAHGFAHRDMIHYNGKIEKTPLFIHNYNEALDFADSDIKTNWQLYLNRYLEEVSNNDR